MTAARICPQSLCSQIETSDLRVSCSWPHWWFIFVLLSTRSWRVPPSLSWSLRTTSFSLMMPRLLFGGFPISICSGPSVPQDLQRGWDFRGTGDKYTLYSTVFPLLHWSFNLFELLLPKTEISPPVAAGDVCKCTNTHAYNFEHHFKKFTDPLNGTYEPQAENPSLTAKLSNFNSSKLSGIYWALTLVKHGTGHLSEMNKAQSLHRPSRG